MEKKENTPSEDVALLCNRTEDGEGAQVLRFRKGTVQAAEVRPVKEGQTLNHQEMVRLHPRKDMPILFDVEVLHAPSDEEKSSDTTINGPARVSNKAYRDNWDRIFSANLAARGKKTEKEWLN